MPIRKCDSQQYTLLTNGSATGSAVLIPGGEYHFMVEGTAGGATFTLQMQSPNGTWSTVSIFAGSAVSATVLPFSQAGISLPAGNVRLGISGGVPANIYAYLVGVG